MAPDGKEQTMNKQQILNEVSVRRREESRFIRWWRKENDFVDYELLDHFVAHLPGQIELGGFELLTTDQMWQAMQRLLGPRVGREKRTTGDVLILQPTRGEPAGVEESPFTPENMIRIFDRETRGNTIQ